MSRLAVANARRQHQLRWQGLAPAAPHPQSTAPSRLSTKPNRPKPRDCPNPESRTGQFFGAQSRGHCPTSSRTPPKTHPDNVPQVCSCRRPLDGPTPGISGNLDTGDLDRTPGIWTGQFSGAQYRGVVLQQHHQSRRRPALACHGKGPTGNHSARQSVCHRLPSPRLSCHSASRAESRMAVRGRFSVGLAVHQARRLSRLPVASFQAALARASQSGPTPFSTGSLRGSLS